MKVEARPLTLREARNDTQKRAALSDNPSGQKTDEK